MAAETRGSLPIGLLPVWLMAARAVLVSGDLVHRGEAAVVAGGAGRRRAWALGTMRPMTGRAATFHRLVNSRGVRSMAVGALAHDQRAVLIVTVHARLVLRGRRARLGRVAVTALLLLPGAVWLMAADAVPVILARDLRLGLMTRSACALLRRRVRIMAADAVLVAVARGGCLLLVAGSTRDSRTRGRVSGLGAMTAETVGVLRVRPDGPGVLERLAVVTAAAERHAGLLQVKGVRRVTVLACRATPRRPLVQPAIGSGLAMTVRTRNGDRQGRGLVGFVAADAASATGAIPGMFGRDLPSMAAVAGRLPWLTDIVLVVTTQTSAVLLHPVFREGDHARVASGPAVDDLRRREPVLLMTADALVVSSIERRVHGHLGA
jgi:hypothetical protein